MMLSISSSEYLCTPTPQAVWQSLKFLHKKQERYSSIQKPTLDLLEKVVAKTICFRPQHSQAAAAPFSKLGLGGSFYSPPDCIQCQVKAESPEEQCRKISKRTSERIYLEGIAEYNQQKSDCYGLRTLIPPKLVLGRNGCWLNRSLDRNCLKICSH